MTYSDHLRAPRRGLTMAIALMLLALVAVALLAVTQLVRDDARRTLDERMDAQLRSLILAAMTDATAHLQQHGSLPAETVVAVPPDAGEAKLSYASTLNDDQWRVQMVARFQDRQIESDCTLGIDAGQWSVRDATIERH